MRPWALLLVLAALFAVATATPARASGQGSTRRLLQDNAVDSEPESPEQDDGGKKYQLPSNLTESIAEAVALAPPTAGLATIKALATLLNISEGPLGNASFVGTVFLPSDEVWGFCWCARR